MWQDLNCKMKIRCKTVPAIIICHIACEHIFLRMHDCIICLADFQRLHVNFIFEYNIMQYEMEHELNCKIEIRQVCKIVRVKYFEFRSNLFTLQ